MPLNSDGKMGKKEQKFQHIHDCRTCGRRWLHETERACLAPATYSCPPCKEGKYAEPDPIYAFRPPNTP